jgi:hypothetical protein
MNFQPKERERDQGALKEYCHLDSLHVFISHVNMTLILIVVHKYFYINDIVHEYLIKL